MAWASLAAGTNALAAGGDSDAPPAGAQLFRIAFGSCHKYGLGQEHWESIAAHRPDLWIWMGDIVYADTKDMVVLRERFRRLKESPEYRAFASAVPVIGVWDDHDFGENNLDGNAPHKPYRQEVLLDFLDEPEDSQRRSQQGVYASYDYESQGARIRVILMDLRYFKNVPPGSGNLLGAEQWAWLEATLRESSADLNVLVSSTQLLRESKRKETWARWPRERARLFDLIGSSGARNVVVLSGDLHAGELSRMALPESGTQLYEFTSSGLTHHRDWSLRFLRNPHREALYTDRNFGQLDVIRTDHGLVAYVRIFGLDDRAHIVEAIELRP